MLRYLGDVIADGAVVKLSPAAGSENVVVDTTRGAWKIEPSCQTAVHHTRQNINTLEEVRHVAIPGTLPTPGGIILTLIKSSKSAHFPYFASLRGVISPGRRSAQGARKQEK
jgi:hypothetical protein